MVSKYIIEPLSTIVYVRGLVPWENLSMRVRKNQHHIQNSHSHVFEAYF